MVSDPNGLFARVCRWGTGLHRWGVARPFAYYTFPLLVWAALIAWGSLKLPSELHHFHFPMSDKVQHILAYTGLGLLMLRGWQHGRLPAARHVFAVVAITAGWGFYLEVLQWLTPYRSFELTDFACDTVGAIAGVSLWLHWLARRDKLAWPNPAHLAAGSTNGQSPQE